MLPGPGKAVLLGLRRVLLEMLISPGPCILLQRSVQDRVKTRALTEHHSDPMWQG